jgi:curved DNA-binding protein CbpA
MEKTLYSVLEVSNTASTEVIHAAHERLKALLAPKAATGDEAARIRLQAVTEAFRTLCDPQLRASYDQRLAHRAVQARAIDTDPSPSTGKGPIIAIVTVALLVIAGWNYNQARLLRAEQRAMEESRRERMEADAKAAAQAEADRAQRAAERAEREAERQRRIEEQRYQQWVTQTRQEGTAVMRQNEAARRQAEREELREQERVVRARDRDERLREQERAREDAAAARRLEQEKRRLRELQYENSRR